MKLVRNILLFAMLFTAETFTKKIGTSNTTPPQKPNTVVNKNRYAIEQQQPQPKKIVPIEKKAPSFGTYFMQVRNWKSNIFNLFHDFNDDFIKFVKNTGGDTQMIRSLLEAAANLHLPLTGNDSMDIRTRTVTQNQINKIIEDLEEEQPIRILPYVSSARPIIAPEPSSELVKPAAEPASKVLTTLIKETNGPREEFLTEFAPRLIKKNEAYIKAHLFQTYPTLNEGVYKNNDATKKDLKILAFNIYEQYPQESSSLRTIVLRDAIANLFTNDDEVSSAIRADVSAASDPLNFIKK
jgi:hypothetical protein